MSFGNTGYGGMGMGMGFGFGGMELENDPIRQFQSEIDELKYKVERLRPVLRSCQEAAIRAEVKVSISVGKRNQLRPKVEMMMICKTLDETVPLFRELAKDGIRTDKQDTHKDAKLFDMVAMREYNLGPDVSLVAMLFEDKNEFGESRCRMEQVGVKEVPVYEMKCD